MLAFTPVLDTRQQQTTLYLLRAELPASSGLHFGLHMGCSDSRSGPFNPASFSSTSAPVALPTVSGTLTVLDATGQFTELALRPSPELAAYLPVTLMDISLNGSPFVQLSYGYLQLEADGTVKLPISGYFAGNGLRSNNPQCTTSDTSSRCSLSPSSHTSPAPRRIRRRRHS